MGFHKRYIDNRQVISLYENGGVTKVVKWYTGKADALILETGLASKIQEVLDDSDWQMMGVVRMEEHIRELILKEMGIEEPRT